VKLCLRIAIRQAENQSDQNCKVAMDMNESHDTTVVVVVVVGGGGVVGVVVVGIVVVVFWMMSG